MEDGTISDNMLEVAVAGVYSLHADKWAKIYNAYNLDYNPIENYDRNEDITDTRTPNINKTITDKGQATRTPNTSTEVIDRGEIIRNPDLTTTTGNSGTDTNTETGSRTNTYDNIKDVSKSTEKTYAFDSTEASPTGETDNENTRTGTTTETPNITTQTTHGLNVETTETGTDRTNRDLTVTTTESGTETNARDFTTTEKETGTETTKHTARVHGNIGVTTSQQMIEAETELRKKLFFNMVMEDLDKCLVMGVY